jgi:HK97 family phage prohead protease
MPTPQPSETHDEFIKRCIPIVINDGTARDGEQAAAICNSIWNRKDEVSEMEPEGKAITKTEQDGEHPASHYLVVEDPKKPSTWHLRVMDKNGKPDHGLMGAAWAALHEGYRGNRYEGPKKQDAIAKLTALYKREKLPLPGKGFEAGETKMLYGQPIQIGEFKAVDDDWIVEGYVSTFGNVDLGNDVVMPGAFTKTLKENPRVRFLLSHDPRLILGVPKKLKEDSKGLFGSFKISKTQLGEDTHQLLLDGAIDSFSIGYQANEFDFIENDVRRLKAVDLFEASLVPLAMNQDALVTRVKDYDYLTLAEKANQLGQEFTQLLNDLRGLVDNIDRPLSETKRQEITELLEKFSGLDAVRSEFLTVLSAAPQPKLVASRLASYELASARKRLARILEE